MGEEGSLGIDKSDGSISALAHLKNFQPTYTIYHFQDSTDTEILNRKMGY